MQTVEPQQGRSVVRLKNPEITYREFNAPERDCRGVVYSWRSPTTGEKFSTKYEYHSETPLRIRAEYSQRMYEKLERTRDEGWYPDKNDYTLFCCAYCGQKIPVSQYRHRLLKKCECLAQSQRIAMSMS